MEGECEADGVRDGLAGEVVTDDVESREKVMHVAVE